MVRHTIFTSSVCQRYWNLPKQSDARDVVISFK